MRHLRLVHSAPTSGEDDGVEPEVRMLLEHVRTLTPLPNVVRARALVRARAALAATSPASTIAGPARARRPSWATLLVAIALAWAVGTAAGALLARRSNATDSPPHATASSPIAAFETARPRESPAGPRR